MGNKERDFGQQKNQKPQQSEQQGMPDDRSDREAGKPLQLDNEPKNDKMHEKQGGQQQQGQPQQGGKHQQGGQQGGERQGGERQGGQPANR